ncbi:MAG: alanine racemase [Fimbriimonadaceae bacterium]
MDPYPRTWAEIDLPALGRNLARVRGLVGQGVKVAIVVKADAYGHGLIPVSRYAVRNGADWVAVATVQEGIALRDAGVDVPVLVMSPMLEIEAEQAVFYALDVVVERLASAEALGAVATATGKRARVHLKVDTGLSRFGVTPDEAPNIAMQIKGIPGVELVGMSQHFSNSYADERATEEQARRFERAVQLCAQQGVTFENLHMANSAATWKRADTHRNMVRVGLLAYGFGGSSKFVGCEPILSWKARITAMRTVPAGTGLSYNSSFVTERESRIATVGVGYGDGYPRSASNRASVTLLGQTARVVGTVCMDQLLIDVTDFSEAHLGDVVTLIGGLTTADDLGDAAGTIAHEVLCRLMSRVPRRYDFG